MSLHRAMNAVRIRELEAEIARLTDDNAVLKQKLAAERKEHAKELREAMRDAVNYERERNMGADPYGY